MKTSTFSLTYGALPVLLLLLLLLLLWLTRYKIVKTAFKIKKEFKLLYLQFIYSFILQQLQSR